MKIECVISQEIEDCESCLFYAESGYIESGICLKDSVKVCGNDKTNKWMLPCEIRPCPIEVSK